MLFKIRQPNYSSTAFNSASRPQSTGPTGPASTLGSVFGDLLNDSSFPSKPGANKANPTLNSIKREQNAANGTGEVDPDRLKVLDWTDGKKANIRALLCSMDKVTNLPLSVTSLSFN